MDAGGSKYQEKNRGRRRLTPTPETIIPNTALPNSHFQDAFRTGCVNFSSGMHPIIPVRFRQSKYSPFEIHSRFHSGAETLRKEFDSRFEDSVRADSKRFCWDFWNRGDQYRLLRTPAAGFFSNASYLPFLRQLTEWGRENLGCQMISHPWLSAYVDGCQQRLHTDVPHGPFSFVFSLTRWKNRVFRGGETLLARPTLIRCLAETHDDTSHEESDLLEKIAPEFNRLTVFDPRFPHGVERVDGVPSILDSRLVIHGWFTEPRPMIEGSLGMKQALRPMDAFAGCVLERLSEYSHTGLLTLRLEINASGKPESINVLSDHLLDGLGHRFDRKLLRSILLEAPVEFPRSRGRTRITLPLELRS